jgi:hypothetical protein
MKISSAFLLVLTGLTGFIAGISFFNFTGGGPALGDTPAEYVAGYW